MWMDFGKVRHIPRETLEGSVAFSNCPIELPNMMVRFQVLRSRGVSDHNHPTFNPMVVLQRGICLCLVYHGMRMDRQHTKLHLFHKQSGAVIA